MAGLLSKIIKHYLSSGDFNGFPVRNIDILDKKEAADLICTGLVEAVYNEFNPHIKIFDKVAPIEEQLKWVDRPQACLFPTPEALKDIPKDTAKKYTAELQSGHGKFELRFFKVDVLEHYYNNPKYRITDSGYRGNIVIRDEYYDEEDRDYLKDFGMAYPADGTINRAIAAFVGDLAELSENTQMRWASYEVNASDWCVNKGFIMNTLYGQWVTYAWIYDCLLEEQKLINEICDKIGISHIYAQTWEPYYGRPDGFRTILFPTKKNYYDFVIVLEKITANNISTKAFTKVQNNTKSIVSDGNKGSITLLGEWLKANGRNAQIVDDTIIAPLKKIRRIRQTPAHEIVSNEYDIKVYEEQNELIHDAFMSVHCLRIMLSSHPLARSVIIPDYLENESKIVIY